MHTGITLCGHAPSADCDEPAPHEYTVTERVGLVTRWLTADGERMTTAEIAARLAMTELGAQRLCDRLSRVVAIYLDDSGTWRRVE